MNCALITEWLENVAVAKKKNPGAINGIKGTNVRCLEWEM